MVARTPLNVALHVHRVSRLYLRTVSLWATEVKFLPSERNRRVAKIV